MRKLVFIILAFLPILLIVTIGIASKVYSQRTYIYVESVVFTDEFENEYPSDKIIRLSPEVLINCIIKYIRNSQLIKKSLSIVIIPTFVRSITKGNCGC